MTIDYLVRFLPLPSKVNECVTKNDDDSYTIIINVNINAEEQKKAFEHALTHIIGEDFSKKDVQEIERNAHDNEIEIVDNFEVKE